MKSAIVGLGAIAPTHFDAIVRAHGEVVAVCDTDEAQAKRFFEKTGCEAPLFSALGEMLAAGGFDVLHICTPALQKMQAILLPQEILEIKSQPKTVLPFLANNDCVLHPEPT